MVSSKFYSWLSDILGVDSEQLRAVLKVKSLVSSRQSLTGATSDNHQTNINASLLQLGLFFVFGLFASAGLLFDSALSGLSFSYTLIMMILGLTFVSHLSTVLLDTTESQILLPRPISGRTILAARTIHVSYYMASLAVSCGFATMVAIGYKHGFIAIVIFIITLLLLVLFLNVVTQIICLFALVASDPKKIRTIILYCLVFFTIAIFLAFNFFVVALNKDIDFSNVASTNIEGVWMYVYPPSWMAGLMSVYLEQTEKLNANVLAVTGVVIPVIGLFSSMYFFNERYTRMLSKLEVSSNKKKNELISVKKKNRILSKLLALDYFDSAVFNLVTKLMKSDLSFKVRTYPLFGMMLAFIVSSIFILPDSVKGAPVTGDLLYFLLIYVSTSFMVTTLANLKYSDQHKAGWIYQILPILQPGKVVTATIKAFVWRFILPLNAILMYLCYFEWGVETVFDTLCAGIVSILMCLLQGEKMKAALALPFTRDFSVKVSSANANLHMLIIVAQLFVMGGTHALVKFVAGPAGVLLLSVAVATAVLFVYRRLEKFDWDELNIVNQS